MSLILPRTSTVARILRDDATLAHKVAWEVCYSQCLNWCFVASHAGLDKVRPALATIIANLNCAEYTARIARPAVRRVWDDQRDCCDPEDIGRFCLSDGTPQGCLDVCGAAGLVAASVTGLVEPEDDYGNVIAEWYRDIIEREWRGKTQLNPDWKLHGKTARADITGDVLRPRSTVAWMAENEAKWPDATPFRVRLDNILGDAIRGQNVR